MRIINPAYRFTAVFMALLVLVSSIGLNVDLHYCSGQLKSISFIGKAKSCHQKSMQDCPLHQKMMADEGVADFDAKNCCANKKVYLQPDFEKNAPAIDLLIPIEFQQLIPGFIAVFSIQPSVHHPVATYSDYRPPNISRAIYVLIQSFLI